MFYKNVGSKYIPNILHINKKYKVFSFFLAIILFNFVHREMRDIKEILNRNWKVLFGT